MGIRRVVAYASIYLLWGGAYLAVQVLVETRPAFLVAGLRYALAALLLIPVILLRRDQRTTLRQALNAIWTGLVMLGLGYGVVFWAEKRLPSWLAAVLLSTTFLWTYMGECVVLRSRNFQAKMLLPVTLGIGGIALLTDSNLHRKGASFPAAIAVLLGSICWSIGTLAVKRIDMPPSHIQTAGFQLATSGLFLLSLSVYLGEWRGLSALTELLAWKPFVAMAYLVVAASILGFVAFHWLLKHEPASLVATSAYVNPIVAMALGICIVHEHYSSIQLIGACAVLASIAGVWYLQSPSNLFWLTRLEAVSEP